MVVGGVMVNDMLLYFVVDGLLFGGVGVSGMGVYYGWVGFDVMSKWLLVLW